MGFIHQDRNGPAFGFRSFYESLQVSSRALGSLFFGLQANCSVMVLASSSVVMFGCWMRATLTEYLVIMGQSVQQSCLANTRFADHAHYSKFTRHRFAQVGVHAFDLIGHMKKIRVWPEPEGELRKFEPIRVTCFAVILERASYPAGLIGLIM